MTRAILVGPWVQNLEANMGTKQGGCSGVEAEGSSIRRVGENCGFIVDDPKAGSQREELCHRA